MNARPENLPVVQPAFQTDYRTLATVARWNIVPTITRQSVAEHSYYVAVYSLQIADMINWDGDYTALLAHALVHDAVEVVTGDIPGPVKRAIEDRPRADNFLRVQMSQRFGASAVQDLTVSQHPQWRQDVIRIVKAADELDGVLFIALETSMGNRSLERIRVSSQARLEGAWRALPGEKHLIEELFQTVVLPAVRRHEQNQIRTILG